MDEELESQGRKMGMVYQVYMQTDRSKTKAQVEEAVAGGVQYVHLFPHLLLPCPLFFSRLFPLYLLPKLGVS